MKLLIVDQDPALSLFLKKGLELEGYEVTVTGDGETALDRSAVQAVDLVVLDLSLPHRDGMEVVAELRRRCQRTAILVLTGRRDLEERVRCLNSGADDFLLKPFQFQGAPRALQGLAATKLPVCRPDAAPRRCRA